MALVKFLVTWLHWKKENPVTPDLMERRPAAKTVVDLADIAMYGGNLLFLQKIMEITYPKMLKYMKAAGLKVAKSSRWRGEDTMSQKMSKPTTTDVEKVREGLSHSDNITVRDLDPPGVTSHVAKAIELKIRGVPADIPHQYPFLLGHATCYALLTLGFRSGLKVEVPSNMEFLLVHISSARMRAKSLLLDWNVSTEVKAGLPMDKLIDRVLAFKKDPDGIFWLTHYALILLGR